MGLFRYPLPEPDRHLSMHPALRSLLSEMTRWMFLRGSAHGIDDTCVICLNSGFSDWFETSCAAGAPLRMTRTNGGQKTLVGNFSGFSCLQMLG
jgi:hypothetical protein